MSTAQPMPKWPHLENLDRILQEDPFYLSQPFVITEKIHGFNGRFGRTADGVPWIGTRNLVVAEGDAIATADGQQGFVAFARHHLPAVPAGVTLSDEDKKALGKVMNRKTRLLLEDARLGVAA